MKPQYFLLIFFIVISLTKLILSTLIHSPHIVMDESIYAVMANRIWDNHTYITDRPYGAQYPPLYPILISPFTSFDTPMQFFKYALFYNAFLSTLIIFPTYYLAKEYLPKSESISIAFLVGIMPSSFIYSFTFMSENLLLPVFLTSVYFMKRTLSENNFKNNLLSGIFISMTILVKLTGIALIVVYGMVKLYQYNRKRIQ